MNDITDATRPSRVSQEPTMRRMGRITLRVLSGPTAGKTVVISKSRIIVGRSRTADLTLDHASVSGAHFELRVESHGVEIRDLQSTNGIRVGQTMVFHAVLGPGAVVSAGECEVQLVAVGEIEVPVFANGRLGAMLGSSRAMREIFAQVERLARTPLDALVTGETGTGKELVSQAIHSLSNRSTKQYVTLDCGTLARGLVESAIFGYRRGAFTGAEADSAGFVENANGGTLFIDEIGELPLDLQVKLLRVLDRREVVRIGETRPRSVDIRVIAATNRDLEKMVADGQFREDLYFRLSRARVELPPLRKRDDDVIELAQHFTEEVALERGLNLRLSQTLKESLRHYSWPGNIRELRGVIRYAGHFVDDCEIDVDDVVLGSPTAVQAIDHFITLKYRDAHRELDRIYLTNALRKANGSAAACARMIGMSRTTLRRRLEVLDLASVD